MFLGFGLILTAGEPWADIFMELFELLYQFQVGDG